MLLEEINNSHEGTYDFFYLPIDFKNKCNVGYCFINFLDPKHIVAFVKEFNGLRWKSFNSEKVCAITFARIQGKGSMVSRFQNSSLLEKDDEYRPLLFFSSGPDRGKPEPFPSSARSLAAHQATAGGVSKHNQNAFTAQQSTPQQLAATAVTATDDTVLSDTGPGSVSGPGSGSGSGSGLEDEVAETTTEEEEVESLTNTNTNTNTSTNILTDESSSSIIEVQEIETSILKIEAQ